MNDTDVTAVTRNEGHPEISLAIDLVCWGIMLYVMTHPDAFDKVGDLGRRAWKRTVFAISIWAAKQDIRSLPETEA